MKIIQNTPDRLILVHRPWVATVLTWVLGASAVLAAIAGGEDLQGPAKRLFVLVLGLGVMAVAWRLMPFTTLVFDRAAGQLSRHRHRVTGTESAHYPLGDISRALHQSNWSDTSRLERLAIETGAGRVPLEIGFTPTPRAPLAAAINNWLAATQDR